MLAILFFLLLISRKYKSMKLFCEPREVKQKYHLNPIRIMIEALKKCTKQVTDMDIGHII